MRLKGARAGGGGGACPREISSLDSFCHRSQLTSLVAFVAGKLTLKDMSPWKQVLEHFSFGKLHSAGTILQGRDTWEESR